MNADNLLEVTRNVLERRWSTIQLSVRQRAKFEGWLKIELAHALEMKGFRNVRLEQPYEQPYSGGRADISFSLNGGRCFLELKTCNTNWKVEGVERHTRPITRNIESVLKDVSRVKQVRAPDAGAALVVFFPIPPQWSPNYLENRINDWRDGPRLLSENPHSAMLNRKLNRNSVGIAIFVFGPYRDGILNSEV